MNPDGSPHVTPIGSLLLDANETKGVYFEIFTQQLRKNIESNPKVCVLATNSSRWFWVTSFFKGKFSMAPAFRLIGTAGVRRSATPEEIARWEKRVRFLRPMKGYAMMWGNLTHVREIIFDRCEPVRLGKMT